MEHSVALQAAAAPATAMGSGAGAACRPEGPASTAVPRTAVSGAVGHRTSRCCAMHVGCTIGRCRACLTTPVRWRGHWRYVLRQQGAAGWSGVGWDGTAWGRREGVRGSREQQGGVGWVGMGRLGGAEREAIAEGDAICRL
jgi:hypothetical protein